jgi:hypothetical protein
MEEWREITDYPNYEISNLGNVRNKKGNTLALYITRKHYYIKLYKNSKGKNFILHRLIAIAFIPNPDNFLEIDHIDRNPLNNSLDNLRWVSRSQNVYNRNMKTQNSTSKFRGLHWDKSKNKWVARIRLNGKGKHIGYFETEEEGARAFNEFVISHNLGEFVDLNIIE